MLEMNFYRTDRVMFTQKNKKSCLYSQTTYGPSHGHILLTLLKHDHRNHHPGTKLGPHLRLNLSRPRPYSSKESVLDFLFNFN